MIRLDDITESQKEQMRELVHEEVERLTEIRNKEDIDHAVRILYRDYLLKGGKDTSMGSAMYSAMDSATYSAMSSAMDSATYSAIDSDVYSAMHLLSMGSTIGSAMSSAMDSNMDSAMISAMYSAMDSATYSAMSSEVSLKALCNGLYTSHYWRYWALIYRCAKAAGVDFSGCQKKYDDFQTITRNATIGIWFKDFCFVFPNFHIAKMQHIGETDDALRLPRYELHALGEPALQLYDVKLYYYHNMKIPEKYGAAKVSDWDPKWFIEERNVEYKQMLAAEMGYDRIFQALEAKEIDSYREYRLWRAETGDVEPINILQMTCPSTGHLHYGRVPPSVMSARLAATVYNYGLPPESFDKEA